MENRTTLEVPLMINYHFNLNTFVFAARKGVINRAVKNNVLFLAYMKQCIGYSKQNAELLPVIPSKMF